MCRLCRISASVLLATAATSCPAQTFENLYLLGDDAGAQPNGALIEGRDGNFYGTAINGGRWGYGTVFKVTVDGQCTPVFTFNGTNGASPYGALVEASDGNFYGTTLSGWGGWASVFRLAPGGQLTIAAWLGIGVGPVGDLLEGPDGKLYGVTQYGGGCDVGTIFRVSTNESIETLYSFCGGEGSYPSGGLILASDGNFYGAAGGAVGTIFQMTPDGALNTFDRFNGWTGAEPVGGLVQAPDGYLYGSAYRGGSNYEFGAVFRVSLGQPCSAHSWDSCANLSAVGWFGETAPGLYPYAGLTLGTDGNLYGTTAFGGYGAGNIFRIIMPGPKLNSTSVDRTWCCPGEPTTRATFCNPHETCSAANGATARTRFPLLAANTSSRIRFST